MSRILILLFIFSSSYYAFSQQSTGLIPIEKFNSDKLGAQPHCFAFAQDSRNAIYVGNKDRHTGPGGQDDIIVIGVRV